MKIKCYIPMYDGLALNNLVLMGLSIQNVQIGIIPVTRPRIIKSNVPGRRDRPSITKSRNAILDCVEKIEDEFFMHLDSDVVLTGENDVYDMISFLIKNEEYAAVALNTKRPGMHVCKKHVALACQVIRRECVKGYRFHNGDHNGCNCITFARDMAERGYKINYLDGRLEFEIKGSFSRSFEDILKIRKSFDEEEEFVNIN